MLAIEYVILILLYTSLTISLLFQCICYRRKIENLETIALTSSLLLLVISISISPLLPEENTTTLYTLICMVLVGFTTFLQTLGEQNHNIPKVVKHIYAGISVILLLFICIAKFYGNMYYVQFVVVGFLLLSVVLSMLITRKTAPKKQFKHLEKSNKIFATTFFILVPVYLIIHYFFENDFRQFQIGFLLYFAIFALMVRKIYDDLQRLSLIKSKLDPKEQQLENYGLTNREQEVVTLLLKGLTYQDIADRLFISLPTVKTHASNIYRKCGVKSRNELNYLITN